MSSSYFCVDYKYDMHDEFVRIPETQSLSLKKKSVKLFFGVNHIKEHSVKASSHMHIQNYSENNCG